MAAPFDTHKAVRRLRDGGLEEAAAGAVVTTIREAVDTLVTREVLQLELATIRAEMADLRTEMADLRADLRAEMADLRTEMADLRADLRAEMADLRAEMADLRTGMADLRAGLYRALWIQGAGIVAIVGVLVAVA